MSHHLLIPHQYKNIVAAHFDFERANRLSGGHAFGSAGGEVEPRAVTRAGDLAVRDGALG